MDYITSDQHFFHKNICGEDGFVSTRKHFKNVEEMNEVLIQRWNEKVKPSDTIFHLGDVLFGGSELWNRIMPQLNGHKILILGNHKINKF